MNIDSLIREHTSIKNNLEKLGAKVKPFGASISSSEAIESRYELSQILVVLKLHLAKEDLALYPKLLKSSQAHTSTTALSFQDEINKLVAFITSFDKKWQADDIRSHPQKFSREFLDLSGKLMERLKKEDKILYKLL